MKKFIILIIILLISILILYNFGDNYSINVVNKLENNDTVILGGNAVGLRLLANGVLVVGSDRKDNKLKIADVIFEVNDVKINSNDELINEINKSSEEYVNLKILRNSKTFDIKINLLKEEYESKLGVWVKDSSAGIGTVTFIYNNKFASLGHPVTETKENKILPITTRRVN